MDNANHSSHSWFVNKTGCSNRCMIVGLLLVMFYCGCSQTQEPPSKPRVTANPKTAESTNQAILDEANAAKKWFHAKKVRPIWAKRLEQAQTVKTLEGEEQVAAGNYLCKGEAKDIWPQTEKDLNKRYSATEEVDAEGWRKYQPHHDAAGVMATQIDHPFEVEASWGKLKGKRGDFLVKNFQDRETVYPADVWIVDQTLFEQTYESVGNAAP
jgi:hypothetical protein